MCLRLEPQLNENGFFFFIFCHCSQVDSRRSHFENFHFSRKKSYFKLSPQQAGVEERWSITIAQ